MVHTLHLTHGFIHLLVLALALVGLTGWPALPSDAAGSPAPRDVTDDTDAALLAGPPAAARLTPPDEATRARVQAAYGHLPLSFEANHGQTDPRVKFLARGRGYNLFLTSQEAVLVVSPPTGRPTAPGAGAPPRAVEARSATPSAVVRMQLVGAHADPPGAGHETMPGKSHYLIGRDPRQWRTDIPQYGTVTYEGVYPGVDLLYYGRQGQLEYDFVVRPGADPRAITLAFTGVRDVRLGAGGELVLGVEGGEIRQRAPVLYQEVDGVRQAVAGGYRIEEQQHVRFEVGPYDVSRPLVIDPVLVYASYLGGSGVDVGSGIAVDLLGQAYVTGYTTSADFPTTPGAFQPGHAGSEDAFVAKLDRSGSALVYASYLGGSGEDRGFAIAVDLVGQAYVTGHTASADFPVTSRALQPAYAGGAFDAFVAKIGADDDDDDDH
jgi:Beta-propeller repeat